MTRPLLLALLLLTGLAPAAATPIRLDDDAGTTVELPAAPARVVSLLPSLTETVCALGQCARLVGVDRYSTWPESIAGLPRLGGGLDPNIEAITALRPDLVLVATSSRASERLRALGLRVLALEPRSQADVHRVIGKLALALGLPAADGERLWQHIETDIDAIAATLPAAVRGTRVYFEVNRAPYAAGASSFIGETLARLGALNIVPAGLGPFPKLNPEYVVRADPALIMVGDRNYTGMDERPGWSGIRAIRERRVCVFAPEQSEVLVHPGPRMPEAARIMADCLVAKGQGLPAAVSAPAAVTPVAVPATRSAAPAVPATAKARP
ncbi:ABC transporter substrate-binding protein [Derxia gummosa]|uniref:ABC transporter substrate-binding protein n=1 Tax=Derxia gummosa DSM 723 TaxID=1121388 RepID=A0A8B6XAS7_9BURK|nr:helical backbone metal receptor [Derxia gummosa]